MSEEENPHEMSAFLIKDVTTFAKELRTTIIQQLIDSKEIARPKKGERLNKNDYITIKQVIGIIRDNIVSINDNNEFIVDMDCMDEIYFRVCDSIHGTLISRLASQGVIESAWDEEKNKFIFWFAE
tara:strand:- start:2467 stop:2844 length:378 start_codon:yes stop_codon:yes gene_type:complete